jgi:hypothetical protein
MVGQERRTCQAWRVFVTGQLRDLKVRPQLGARDEELEGGFAGRAGLVVML